MGFPLYGAPFWQTFWQLFWQILCAYNLRDQAELARDIYRLRSTYIYLRNCGLTFLVSVFIAEIWVPTFGDRSPFRTPLVSHWNPYVSEGGFWRKIDGSRPSDGVERATGYHAHQKSSWNSISWHASAFRGVLGHINSIIRQFSTDRLQIGKFWKSQVPTSLTPTVESDHSY